MMTMYIQKCARFFPLTQWQWDNALGFHANPDQALKGRPIAEDLSARIVPPFQGSMPCLVSQGVALGWYGFTRWARRDEPRPRDAATSRMNQFSAQ